MASVEMNQNDYENTLALELGNTLIKDVAPEEASDFEAIINEYNKAKNESPDGEHPLAFGVGDLVNIMSPYVFEAAKVIIGFLLLQAASSAKNIATAAFTTGTDLITERLTNWMKGLADGKQPLPLNADQEADLLARIRKRLAELKANPQITEAVMKSVDDAIRPTP
ncbi:hypothetical protein [Rhizobium sp. CF142]|uniref:hypothetical protein n=1 Tax=Rhizobium sp. CF142 TaxID=1144314 RepID=UPI00026EFE13|nr:hypothetical protein [Rhizobium sp. CF142]EJJ24521.1 hypothetical protein PMI11_07276 [Rhizobium sp. CF142]